MEGAVETEVKEAGDAKADLGKMNDNENYNGKSEAVTVDNGDSEITAENEAAHDVDLEDGEIEDDDEEEEQVHQMEQ